eukprot:scaffold62889_cov48-Phaeocystis_antarctica.AAC.2
MPACRVVYAPGHMHARDSDGAIANVGLIMMVWWCTVCVVVGLPGFPAPTGSLTESVSSHGGQGGGSEWTHSHTFGRASKQKPSSRHTYTAHNIGGSERAAPRRGPVMSPLAGLSPPVGFGVGGRHG